MLIDSHAHLNLNEYFSDLTAVKQQMTEAGVEAAVVVGIDLDSSRRALDLACDWIFPTAGIHPQESHFQDTPEEWAQLEALLKQPQVVAVGETGIDTHHQRVPVDVQEKRFVKQLALAREHNLPVVVHCRDALDTRSASQKVMDILQAHGQNTRGVLHCFAGDPALGQLALDMGWSVSLAGNLTFKNARDLRDVVSKLQGERFLLETDCPFLAPHPHRGQGNHPALMVHTAKALAEVRGWSQDETIKRTRRATIELFDLPLEAA